MKTQNTQSQPRTLRRRALRLTLYLLATVIAVAAIVSYYYIADTGTTNTTNTNASARDVFDDLYQVGLRADGSAGNTEVDAVYYYPALSESLLEYTDRSQQQAATLSELEQYSATGMFPFVVTLLHNEAFDESFDVTEYATLTADGTTTYEVDRWQPIDTGDTSGTTIVGVLWFRQPDGAGDATSFTLTFTGLPGNTKETSFNWNAAVLSAVQ